VNSVFLFPALVLFVSFVVRLLLPGTAAAFCLGDCDDNGSVEASEAAICEDLRLNGIPIGGNPCVPCDCNGNFEIESDELARAMNNVGQTCNPGECPPPTRTPRPTGSLPPTATRTASPTAPVTATSTAVETPEATPTVVAPTATPGATTCVGNCNGDTVVAINELLQGVNIALGNAELDVCPAFDNSGNGQVEVNELIIGVSNALNGCP
jgi:hypothetical protein